MGWNPAFSRSVLAFPMDWVSLYGPTRTRMRLLGPWVNEAGKPLSLRVLTMTSASGWGTAMTCQYEPGGPAGAAGTAAAGDGAVASGTRGACVTGCGGASVGGAAAAEESGAGTGASAGGTA